MDYQLLLSLAPESSSNRSTRSSEDKTSDDSSVNDHSDNSSTSSVAHKPARNKRSFEGNKVTSVVRPVRARTATQVILSAPTLEKPTRRLKKKSALDGMPSLIAPGIPSTTANQSILKPAKEYQRCKTIKPSAGNAVCTELCDDEAKCELQQRLDIEEYRKAKSDNPSFKYNDLSMIVGDMVEDHFKQMSSAHPTVGPGFIIIRQFAVDHVNQGTMMETVIDAKRDDNNKHNSGEDPESSAIHYYRYMHITSQFTARRFLTRLVDSDRNIRSGTSYIYDALKQVHHRRVHTTKKGRKENGAKMYRYDSLLNDDRKGLEASQQPVTIVIVDPAPTNLERLARVHLSLYKHPLELGMMEGAVWLGDIKPYVECGVQFHIVYQCMHTSSYVTVSVGLLTRSLLSLSLYIYIDVGDLIILYGNSPHKFYKSVASVSLATNVIGPLDLIRIMDLIDGWVVASAELRTSSHIVAKRLITNGITMGAREQWYGRFGNAVFIGDHSIRSTLSLVWRARAAGIGIHPLLRDALRQRLYQALLLDKQEQPNTGRWVEAIKLIIVEEYGPYTEAKLKHAREYWCTQTQPWEREEFVDMVNKKRKACDTALKKSINSIYDAEYCSVDSNMACIQGLPPVPEKKKQGRKDNSEEPDIGLHESQPLLIPTAYSDDMKWFPDSQMEFILGGGYIRFCRQFKDGGQYGWSGKICEPNEEIACGMKYPPCFNLFFHRYHIIIVFY